MGELMLQNPAVQAALNPIKLYARIVGRKWSFRFPHRMIKNYYVWSVLKSRDLLCERRCFKYHSFQGNGFLGTDFLTTKAGDTRVGVYLGKMVIHGQSRYRTLIDTGATACA